MLMELGGRDWVGMGGVEWGRVGWLMLGGIW